MDDWDFWVPGIEGIFGHFGSQSFDLRGLVARLGPKSPPFRHLGRRLFIVLDSCGSKSEIRCPELGVTERANLGAKLDLILCAME